MGDLVDVNLTVREDQKDWARDNHVNLSSLLREVIDNRMEDSK